MTAERLLEITISVISSSPGKPSYSKYALNLLLPYRLNFMIKWYPTTNIIYICISQQGPIRYIRKGYNLTRQVKDTLLLIVSKKIKSYNFLAYVTYLIYKKNRFITQFNPWCFTSMKLVDSIAKSLPSGVLSCGADNRQLIAHYAGCPYFSLLKSCVTCSGNSFSGCLCFVAYALLWI